MFRIRSMMIVDFPFRVADFPEDGTTHESHTQFLVERRWRTARRSIKSARASLSSNSWWKTVNPGVAVRAPGFHVPPPRLSDTRGGCSGADYGESGSDRTMGEPGLRFIAYLHISTESP